MFLLSFLDKFNRNWSLHTPMVLTKQHRSGTTQEGYSPSRTKVLGSKGYWKQKISAQGRV